MMKKTMFSILILILASLACGQYITPTPTVPPVADTAQPTQAVQHPTERTISPSETATNTPRIVITAETVNVRDASGSVVGYVHAGESYAGACGPEWCAIEPGLVWRGCTDQATKGQGCK